MNYSQTLTKAQTLLDQRHHAQAVQAAASALESLLVELYNQLLGQSPPARQKQLIEAQEQVGGGQPLHKLTLGKLVGVYRASRAHQDLEQTLGLKLTYLNLNALGPLVDIRNRAVHEGHEPDPAEAAYIVNQVALILRETGRLPPPAQPPIPTTQYPIPPWWHTAIPHRDIREGRLDLKVFAVDLAQVIEGHAVSEYKDADTFFRRTFLTRGLRETLKGVLRRLAGRDDGIAITQMATVFGGGKTHTLLALYHIVAHGAGVSHLEPVEHILAEAGVDASSPLLGGGAKVAAVDCAHISPSQPRQVTGTSEVPVTLHTLWGEIAYRLAGVEGYEIVRQSDEQRVAPGSEALEKLFQLTGPALILIDETLAYITKASGIPVGKGYLSDQAQEFLLELTRAVNAAADVALVLTMTSSEQEQIGEAAIRAAREIDTAIRILRRTRQVEVSAEREELYEILKRRLFDTDPAQIEAQARDVARTCWDYYRAHPNDFPQEAQSPEYRDLLIRAYPFHPALIEVLRDRWGSISGFQRTRGVLRLLALIIGDLYRRQHAAPLIQPAHVNLDDGEIRAELLEYVDNRGGYESAIFSDIGGTGESKAPHLDRVTGGDYARHSIATGLATSIFMFSHSGATQHAASAERPQLWLATLQPGIVPALAADALDKLQRRLWYLDVREGAYRIDSQPNLNQMLVTRVDAIRQEPEPVRERVRVAVEEVVGKRPFPELVIWPGEPGRVPNRRVLTLVVLGPEHAWERDETRQQRVKTFIEDILGSAGNTPSLSSGHRFRQFKNTLVFALPTADGVRIMEETAVRLLALEAIHRQYRPSTGSGRSGGGLSATQMEELNTQLDQARKGLPGAVWGAYTVTVAPTGGDNGEQRPEQRPEPVEGLVEGAGLWVRQEYGFPGYRPGEHSVAERVWKRLMDDQRLLDRLDPRLISEGKGDQWRLWRAEDERINVATLWDYFCRFPYLPMLTGPEALQHTLSWGVQRGLFAYALGDGETFDTIHFREPSPSSDFAIIEGAWLLRPALAERLLAPEEAEAPLPPPAPSQPPEIDKGRAGDRIVTPTPPPPVPGPTPPPAVYKQVTIETPVDWRQWYDFYQAVIKPLVESGAEVRLQLRLEASGEVDANLVDLSVKESVLQFNPQGRVEVYSGD
jgi:hypothetical protein